MRTLAAGLVAVTALGLSGLATPSPARAQPYGSYAQTCRDSRVSGSQLSARCLDSRGRERSTSLDVGSCRGDIANVNGTLTCEGGRGGGAYYPQGGAVGRYPYAPSQNYPNTPSPYYPNTPSQNYPNNGYRAPGGYNGR